jgi:tRNA(Ile)-lysidine synthase
MTESGLAAHRARRALREFLVSQSVEPGDYIVLGVSGGADSLALAAAAASIKNELAVTFVPVVVDHGLQPGSADVAANAAQKCRDLGLDSALVVTVEVDLDAGDGLEAAARAARYQALRKVAAEHSARGICVAHSLEDQAETVLLRLARGSGSRAIAAMQSVTGDIWRPFLGFQRKDLRIALTHYELEPFDDAHNVDPRFLRSRIRSEVMPLLR